MLCSPRTIPLTCDAGTFERRAGRLAREEREAQEANAMSGRLLAAHEPGAAVTLDTFVPKLH